MSPLLAPSASLERLYTGTEWGESPVWLPGIRALRWSDIPSNRILQYRADDGQTIVYRDNAEFTNGRTPGLNGEASCGPRRPCGLQLHRSPVPQH
jgi:gluconolactonase